MTLPEFPSWLEDSPYSPKYYDKHGMPISMARWSQLLGNYDEKHVAKTDLRVNGHDYYLSTVWLGMDYSFSMHPHAPIIFETMAFCDGDMAGLDEIFDRYSTFDQAMRGHKRWLRVLRRIAREQPRPKQLIHKGGKP